jgi:multiple sugar transport system permease protein
MFPKPIQSTSIVTQILYRVALIVSIIIWLLPLLAIVSTSLHSLDDFSNGNYFGVPERWAFDNYLFIFKTSPMLLYLRNSLIIAVLGTIGTVFFASLAGYILAKFRFLGNTWLFLLFVGGNFVPFQILMIPVRDMTFQLGLYNTLWGLTIFHIAFQTGFAILFMRNFIKILPDELIESARSEGVSEFKIFYHVIMPLTKPAMAALSVLIFTFIWNDFFWGLILVQDDSVKPITSGLNALKGQWVTSWQYISAGSLLAAIPPVCLFFLMQKHFIAGLTLGATKG